MKPTLNQPETSSLLAFGAHPDDIEFGCGGVIARHTASGRPAHLVVCSRGEAGTRGTPEQRVAEAKMAASHLGATVEFLDLDGDAHLEIRTAHAFALAAILRRFRPTYVLAPTLAENQHPDHPKLGQLVRDACRFARYGGLAELRDAAPHAISHLLYYAVTAEAEPADQARILFDVSPPEIVAAWTAAMEAHASQALTRNYSELQLTRARLNGLRCGVEYAVALFPNDPLVVDTLASLGKPARRF